jgi:hypothetical protein
MEIVGFCIITNSAMNHYEEKQYTIVIIYVCVSLNNNENLVTILKFSQFLLNSCSEVRQKKL